MIRPVPKLALDFIDGAEANKLTAYPDSGGVWTVGRGHTGPEVHRDLVITPAQSDAYLFADATHAATLIALAVKDAVIRGLSEHQYSALISFVFNLGLRSSDHIWKALNAGDGAAVICWWSKYDHERIGGKLVEVAGLHNRRAAEITLWKTADVGAAITVAQAAPVSPPPSSYTRAAETPPGPAGGKPLHQSKTFVSACVTGCVAVVGPVIEPAMRGVKTVSDAISPYLAHSAALQNLDEKLAMVAAALAVATAIFAALKNRSAA